MSETPQKKERPLSPHLQVYKPQITSISSILHRMAGIVLMMGLFLITWGLVALAGGRESYDCFMQFCAAPWGQFLLLCWSGAFYYHMCTGLRHFVLDSGYLYEKKIAAISGYVVLVIAIVLTLSTWMYVYKGAL